MAKRRQTLRFRLPPYQTPRIEWRKAIYGKLMKAISEQKVQYAADDKLALTVVLYLSQAEMGWHDVDNRLKDVMDALQGRMGGSKKTRLFDAVIPNDHQIQRVYIEKRIAPSQSRGFGHVVMQKYRSKT